MRIEDWITRAEHRVETPWGLSDGPPKRLAHGIYRVSTPSHGGIYVDAQRLVKIPRKMRDWAERWAPAGWFEEDACWAAVCMTFPECFNSVAREDYECIIRHYFPEENTNATPQTSIPSPA